MSVKIDTKLLSRQIFKIIQMVRKLRIRAKLLEKENTGMAIFGLLILTFEIGTPLF